MAQNILLDIEMEYEYQNTKEVFDVMSGESTTIPGFATDLLFNLNALQDMDNYKQDMEEVANLLRELALGYIQQNGTIREPSPSITNLRDGLFSYVENETIQFGDNATDERGRKYAGHIEWGFTDRAGVGRGPWPFMRPALEMGSEITRGILAERMAEIAVYGPDTHANRHYDGRLRIGHRDVRNQDRSFNRWASRERGSAYGQSDKSRAWSYASNGWKGARNEYTNFNHGGYL